jgi:hypothetical protein
VLELNTRNAALREELALRAETESSLQRELS